MYFYISNETPNIDVLFDNLQVTHIRGRILEETHYYPFGLTMSGISSKTLAFGNPENKSKYNGIEKENDLQIEIYDAQLRELDAQVGRWWQVDPKTENMEMWSPYVSNYNNPLRYSDPLGDEGADCCGGFFRRVWNKIEQKAKGAWHAVTHLDETAKNMLKGENLLASSLDAITFGGYSTTKTLFTEGPEAVIADKIVDAGMYAVSRGLIKSPPVGGTTQEVTTNVIKTETNQAAKSTRFPDEANIVRGGLNKPENIATGTKTHPSGVTGVSVECGMCPIKTLAESLPHNQIGVTTVGAVRKAGGDVIKTSGNSPNHATMTGLTPEKASELLTPPIKNPNK